MTYDLLKKATKWFRVHNIDTFINKSKMYIKEGGFEFELSSEEIIYRAEEYVRLKESNLIKQ